MKASKVVELIEEEVSKPVSDIDYLEFKSLDKVGKEKAESAAGVKYIVGSDGFISLERLKVFKERVEKILETANLEEYKSHVWIENPHKENPVNQHQQIFIGIIEKHGRESEELKV